MAAAEPGGDLHHHRPGRAEAELGVGRAVADPDRCHRRTGRVDGRGRVVTRRPRVGERDAEGRRLGRQAVGHRERDEAPVDRHGVDGHLRPLDVLLHEHRAAAGLGERGCERGLELAGRAHEREPPLALPVGRLHDEGERQLRIPRVELPRMRDAGRGERLPLARLRRDDGPRPGSDRVREPDPLRDARGDPDRPVRTRRDDPVHVARPREPVDRLLVLRRDDRALVRQHEPHGLRVTVDRDHVHVVPPVGRLEQPELRGPGA